MHPAYGDFFSDPRAAMAFQVGGRATEAAGAYVEQNVGSPASGSSQWENTCRFLSELSSSLGNICK